MFSIDELEKREVIWVTDVWRPRRYSCQEYLIPESDSEKKDEPSLILRNVIKDTLLQDRFINIYMVDQIESGLSVAPMDGIMMAECRPADSQVNDASGGVGITDLQVDYGKSNVMGSRKFVIRMTVNDPTYLDDSSRIC